MFNDDLIAVFIGYFVIQDDIGDLTDQIEAICPFKNFGSTKSLAFAMS